MTSDLKSSEIENLRAYVAKPVLDKVCIFIHIMFYFLFLSKKEDVKVEETRYD